MSISKQRVEKLTCSWHRDKTAKSGTGQTAAQRTRKLGRTSYQLISATGIGNLCCQNGVLRITHGGVETHNRVAQHCRCHACDKSPSSTRKQTASFTSDGAHVDKDTDTTRAVPRARTTVTQLTSPVCAFCQHSRLFLLTTKSTVNCNQQRFHMPPSQEVLWPRKLQRNSSLSSGLVLEPGSTHTSTRQWSYPSLTRQICASGRHFSGSVRHISTRREWFVGATADMFHGKRFTEKTNRLLQN